MSEEHNDFIDELTPLNIRTRYLAYREIIYNLIDIEKAAHIIDKTETLLQCKKRRHY